jgi:hypothetical protein
LLARCPAQYPDVFKTTVVMILLGVLRVPVTYIIDNTRKLIRTTCKGIVTLEDVVDHFSNLKGDPDCAGQLDVLLDVREANSLPETDQLRIVNLHVAKIRRKVEFGMCAIVANRDAMFGMMRMFAVFAEKHFRAIRVFRETAEAEEWLTTKQGVDETRSLP